MFDKRRRAALAAAAPKPGRQGGFLLRALFSSCFANHLRFQGADLD
jgi:hypothetical protein